jgi:hypothetical protein
MQRKRVMLIATILLAGCATGSVPQYGADHPANPHAPAAAWDPPPAAAGLEGLPSPSPAADSAQDQPTGEGSEHAHHHH